MTISESKYQRYERLHPSYCIDCEAIVSRRAKRCHTCENRERAKKYWGENNPNWHGGKTRNGGYVYLRIRGNGHPYRGEHIIVWEQANNKKLPNGWIVHHLNGIRDDNRLENLVAMPRKRHSLKLAFQPYEERIRQLEDKLNELSKRGLEEKTWGNP